MNAPLTRPIISERTMSRRRQWLLAAVGTLFIGVIAASAYFLLRPGYQVLFRDLKPRDASAIVAELDKQKIPYRFDDSGTAILVPEDDTRATRLKLLSGDLKLSGVVGLELFNNSDLGLTDFAQKVNYQRALQGELARTIMTLDEIELARVHLTLPEASIFRREQSQPKASIAVFLRDGEVLTASTIVGIQRLVAASVPEMKPGDVTVLDSRGAASDVAAPVDIDDPRFALRRAVEDRLQHKVMEVLAPVIGTNKATVSVSADIDYDQSRITRETDATPTHAVEANVASENGERLTHTALPPLPPSGVASPAPSPPTGPSHRTLEQVVGAPGSIRRLSIGVALDDNKLPIGREALRSLIAAAVGLDEKRGDVLTLVGFALASPVIGHAPGSAATAVTAPIPMIGATTRSSAGSRLGGMLTLGVALVAVVTVLAMLLIRRWQVPRVRARLPEDERAALAARLRLLLEQEAGDHVRS